MGKLAGGGTTTKRKCVCEATLKGKLTMDPLRVVVTGTAWKSTLCKGSGPLQDLLLQRYNVWTNCPLKKMIKGLQTLINLTREHPKLKQVAVVKRVPANAKKIPRRQL